MTRLRYSDKEEKESQAPMIEGFPCPLCRVGCEAFAGKKGIAGHLYSEHKRTLLEIESLLADDKRNGFGIAVMIGHDAKIVE